MTKSLICTIAATSVAVLAFAAMPTIAHAKTAKACEADWKAGKADIQASGKKKKDFMTECRALGFGREGRHQHRHQGRQESREKGEGRRESGCGIGCCSGNTGTGREARGKRCRRRPARPRRDDRARARLRRRLEGRQGRRPNRRSEMAAILERLQQAQESNGHVSLGCSALVSELSSNLIRRRPVPAAVFVVTFLLSWRRLDRGVILAVRIISLRSLGHGHSRRHFRPRRARQSVQDQYGADRAVAVALVSEPKRRRRAALAYSRARRRRIGTAHAAPANAAG